MMNFDGNSLQVQNFGKSFVSSLQNILFDSSDVVAAEGGGTNLQLAASADAVNVERKEAPDFLARIPKTESKMRLLDMASSQDSDDPTKTDPAPAFSSEAEAKYNLNTNQDLPAINITDASTVLEETSKSEIMLTDTMEQFQGTTFDKNETTKTAPPAEIVSSVTHKKAIVLKNTASTSANSEDDISKTKIIKITTKPTQSSSSYIKEIIVPKGNNSKNIHAHNQYSENLKNKSGVCPINIAAPEKEAYERYGMIDKQKNEESNVAQSADNTGTHGIKHRDGDLNVAQSPNNTGTPGIKDSHCSTGTPGIKIVTKDTTPQRFVYPIPRHCTTLEDDVASIPSPGTNQNNSPITPKEASAQRYFNGDINFIATSHYNLTSTLPYDVMPTQAAINTAASGMGHVFPTQTTVAQMKKEQENKDIKAVPAAESTFVKNGTRRAIFTKAGSEDHQVYRLKQRSPATENVRSESVASLERSKSITKRGSQVKMCNFSTESNLDQLSGLKKCRKINEYQPQKQQNMNEKSRRLSDARSKSKNYFPNEPTNTTIYQSCPGTIHNENGNKKLEEEHQGSLESLYTKFDYDTMSKHSETITRNLNAFPSQLPRTPVHVRSISNFAEDSFDDSGYEYLDAICNTEKEVVEGLGYRKLPAHRKDETPRWCNCNRCSSAANGSVCCTRYTELSFLSDTNELCVTESPFFKHVVLSKRGIKFGDWAGKKLYDKEKSSNKLFRHLAYNMFVSLVSSDIRKHWANKSLPSCVVGAIRNAFPEGNAMYSGSVKSI